METFRETLAKLLIPTGRFLAAGRIHPHVLSVSGIVFGVASAYFFISGALALAVSRPVGRPGGVP